MKLCTKCKETLEDSAFYKHPTSKTGLAYWCKSCCSNKGKESYLRSCNKCVDCNERIGPKSVRCKWCRQRGALHYNYQGGRFVSKDGYVRLSGFKGHPNATRGGLIFEHQLIMANHLGRPLVKGENVHHKNGVRDDNRVENLELWVKSQPPGQRPEDLVKWAKEILSRYDEFNEE